jgi:hypothetical protein
MVYDLYLGWKLNEFEAIQKKGSGYPVFFARSAF